MQCLNCFAQMKKEEVKCTNCEGHIHKECAVACVECGNILCDNCSLIGKFKCKTCEEKGHISLPFITRSMIELYKTCPYQFYLRYIKELPEEEGIYALLGTILHNLFDLYSRREIESEEKLYEMFREQYNAIEDKKFETPAQREKLYTKGKTAIKNYLNEEAMMPYPLATESEIFATIDESVPQVKVLIDRINGSETSPDQLEIVDYKTGKIHVGQKLHNDLQPPMYAWALREKYGFLPKRFKLLFLSEEKVRIYELIDDDTYVCTVRKKEYRVSITDTIREIKTIWARIKRGEFGIPDKINSYTCEKMCYYGKTGICQGLEEKWKLANQKYR